jgi:hypothetical protein
VKTEMKIEDKSPNLFMSLLIKDYALDLNLSHGITKTHSVDKE